MSMREEVLKLAEECGLDAVWLADCDNEAKCMNRFYQAAYLAGAKAMQEEAEKQCRNIAEKRWPNDLGPEADECLDAIRAINPESLGGV